MRDDILYSERQHFRQIWVWLLMAGVNGIFIYGLVQQIGFGIPFGDKPASDTMLIVVSLFLFALTLSLALMRLDTRITHEGIYVRFYPVHGHFRFYSWASLRFCYVRKYKPILEYGGWGLRGLGNHRALNMSGHQGIQLVTIDGLKLLIGTQKAGIVTELLQKHHWWKQPEGMK